MRKLFISQPMKGKTDEEILAVRKKTIENAKEHLGEPVEVIDLFFQNVPVDARPLRHLGKSFKLLAIADVAYFAPGWKTARGYRTENTYAIEYDIDVIEDYAECTECLAPFGKAIGALRTGCKMARKGWNEKSQYVQLVTNISYPNADGSAVNVEHGAIGSKAIAFVGASGVQMDWPASQANMLAEDWKVME